MTKNHVGNQLLEAGILFHLIAPPIEDVVGPQQFVEILIDLAAEPLKVPQPVKKLGGNHQYAFNLILGHDGILAGVGNSGFNVFSFRVYPNLPHVSTRGTTSST